ncbi:30S ribosomal protein S21 [Candidatus Roizmanbacteria bacterium]|nr:30S ribosomal protein S21 [Candidatus Roizmanbacteria bacterium]
MVFVSKKKGESKDSLFRKFTRIFIEEDMVTEVRKKLFYKKPSILRKEKEKELLKSKRPMRNFRRRLMYHK